MLYVHNWPLMHKYPMYISVHSSLPSLHPRPSDFQQSLALGISDTRTVWPSTVCDRSACSPNDSRETIDRCVQRVLLRYIYLYSTELKMMNDLSCQLSKINNAMTQSSSDLERTSLSDLHKFWTLSLNTNAFWIIEIIVPIWHVFHSTTKTKNVS